MQDCCIGQRDAGRVSVGDDASRRAGSLDSDHCRGRDADSRDNDALDGMAWWLFLQNLTANDFVSARMCASDPVAGTHPPGGHLPAPSCERVPKPCSESTCRDARATASRAARMRARASRSSFKAASRRVHAGQSQSGPVVASGRECVQRRGAGMGRRGSSALMPPPQSRAPDAYRDIDRPLVCLSCPGNYRDIYRDIGHALPGHDRDVYRDTIGTQVRGCVPIGYRDTFSGHVPVDFRSWSLLREAPNDVR
jgi:hypothetical protein